jgi:hypothetical protein
VEASRGRTDCCLTATIPSIRDAVVQTDADVTVLHAAALSDLVTGQFTLARLNAILLVVWWRSNAAGCRWPLFAARSRGQGASSRTCHPSGNWSHACSPSAYRRCSRGLALWRGTCVRARRRTRLRSAARHCAVRCRVERPLHGIGSGRPPNDHLGWGQLCPSAAGHSTRCDCAVAGWVSGVKAA